MRKLIAPLLLTSLLTAPTWACSPAHGPEYFSDDANVSRADAIFIAHITRVDEVPGDSTRPPSALAIYRLVESIKGDVAGIGTIATSYSTCHAWLLPGGDYVLFAERDSDGRLSAMVRHAGTRQHWPRLGKSTEYLNTIKHLASNKTPPSP